MKKTFNEDLAMKKKLQTVFHPTLNMSSDDCELHYYEDTDLAQVDFHTHDYYEFGFFLEGDVEMHIDEEVISITTGDILFISPFSSHRSVSKNQQKPYRRFILWLSRKYLEQLFQSSPDYAYLMQFIEKENYYLFHTDQISFRTVQSKLLRLLEEMHAKKYGRDTQISLCVSDLILCLNRLVYEQNTPKQKNSEYVLYQQLAEYIEEHIEEDLSLDTLARKFFVSKYHVAHVFKDNLGISIHQFITKKRLSLCKEAISCGMNITVAYRSFGFGDYSSFYRAFKKEFGISPKDYRDMQMPL